MPWPVSDRLRDYLEVSYTLERVLGKGGMGCVLLATERALDRRVAIKVLRADAAGDAEPRERFRREARTAARLSHPNIVALHTFGEVDGEMFFVMTFVDGETLAARIKRLGALDAAEVRRIAGALADALDYAHGFGIVHRDIKPENVLLDAASGRPMLTDFGIAREHSARTSLTQTGVIVGTPHYMAPEQAAGGRDIDGRADLYALGVVTYRAFAGRLPFGGESVQDVLRQHMIVEPAPLPTERVDQDPALADIITRALKKDPAARWATGRALADAMRNTEADDGLPESLVGTESVFSRLAYFGGIGILGLTWLPSLSVMSLAEGLASAGALAALVVGAPFIVAGVARSKDRVPFRRVWTLGWRPPRGWQAWWPRRFRRPGDVWDRLPGEVRLTRTVNAVSTYLLLPAEGMAAISMLTPSGRDMFVSLATHKGLTGVLIGGALAFMVGVIAPLSVASMRLRKRYGATRAEVRQVTSTPVVDRRWQQERLARFLAPSEQAGIPRGDALATGDPGLILSLIRDLGGRHVGLPDDLADALKSAVRARDELGAEMGRLRGEVDPQAIEGLDRRLAALSGTHDADLRALLLSQREIIARIERRLDDLGARRLRLGEQLRFLHEQLIELRTHGADDHAEATGRIRAMSLDLRRVGEALHETERLAGGR